MSDEKPITSEQAIMREVSEPLGRIPADPGAEVAATDFPVVLRGYDRLAVDTYVRRTTELVGELQATRSPESAVRAALERVGEEVASILQRAHETAGGITASSRVEAEERLQRAQAEAQEMTAAAERRLKELDAETDRIWAERQRIVEDAQQLAHQLLGLAEAAAARFPAEETGGPGVRGPGARDAEGPFGAESPPAEDPTVETSFRDDMSSPTVALPVPFGELEDTRAIEPVEPIAPVEPVAPGPAEPEPTEPRPAPGPGIGAVPMQEPIGEPSGEPVDRGEPPLGR